MINAFAEALTEKTIDQYKLIELKYTILKRYMQEILDNSGMINTIDYQTIIFALEGERRTNYANVATSDERNSDGK